MCRSRLDSPSEPVTLEALELDLHYLMLAGKTGRAFYDIQRGFGRYQKPVTVPDLRWHRP